MTRQLADAPELPPEAETPQAPKPEATDKGRGGVEAKPAPKAIAGKGEVSIAGRLYKAWDGEKGSLPAAKYDSKNKLKEAGEPRYYLRRGEGRWELTAVFRARGGIHYRGVKILKDSPKFQTHRDLAAKLKKSGFLVLA